VFKQTSNVDSNFSTESQRRSKEIRKFQSEIKNSPQVDHDDETHFQEQLSSGQRRKRSERKSVPQTGASQN